MILYGVEKHKGVFVGRPRAGREKLSRDGIFVAALRIVDEEGIAALSMRRLAGTLGVDPMAIYHHVPGKEAVLAGVAERVYGEMGDVERGGTWRDLVRASARKMREVTRSHPNLALYLVSNPQAGAAAALRANEAMFAALVEAGFSPWGIVRAVDVVADYVHGFAFSEASGGAGERDEFVALIEAQPPGRYPALRSVYGSLREEEMRSDFDAGLEVIVHGIEVWFRGG